MERKNQNAILLPRFFLLTFISPPSPSHPTSINNYSCLVYAWAVRAGQYQSAFHTNLCLCLLVRVFSHFSSSLFAVMEPTQWRVRSGKFALHWPQLVHHHHAAATSPAPVNGSAEAATESDAVSTVEGGTAAAAGAAALLDYAQQWLDLLPTPPPADRVANSNDSTTFTMAAKEEEEAGASRSAGAPCSDDDATMEATGSVSPVAMLNALLVSIVPATAPPSPSSPPPPQQQQQPATWASSFSVPPPAAAAALLDAKADSATLTMTTPVPIVGADKTSLSDVGAMAALLLRHSKWLASGVSHAAGAAPRLPSVGLLTHAYHHALAPACISSSSMLLVRAANAGPPGTHHSTDGSPSSVVLPTSRFPSLPASYRGCLVLLLFHGVRPVRRWARDTLLSLLCASPAAAGAARTPAAASAAETELSSLLVFALQLLCTLKHVGVLPGVIPFTAPHAVPQDGPAEEEGVMVVAQDRVQTIMEGVFHLLTLLTAWEARFAAAMEAWGTAPEQMISATATTETAAAAAAASEAKTASSSSLAALLRRCRATVVLLGGSLVLHGVQALHESLWRGVMEALESRRRARPLSTGGLAKLDPKQAAETAMSHLLRPLNDLFTANPAMPRAVSVAALTIKKTLVKVLVHCLLDNASGLASSREEEAWRRTRLEWLWKFAAALEPPTARVAAPLPGDRREISNDGSRAPQTAAGPALDGVVNSAWVPAKTAGWLLQPLLKNAAQQLQWASAMATAKGKPLNASHDVAAARVAAESVAVLDKAVYGLYLLLDSAVAALPSLLATRYFHDTVAAHESQLLTLAIGGVVHTRTLHALRLHRLLFKVDVRAFAAAAAVREPCRQTPPSSDSNSDGAGTGANNGHSSIRSSPSPFTEVPAVCLQRVWLTLPTLVTQVCKTSLVGAGSAAATRLPLPQVLAQLCAVLTELVEDDAAPCAQWLLLSPGEAMSAAPPPFQWVVQRCLRTMSETLRDQQDMLEKTWLGLPWGDMAAAVAPAVIREAAVAAASRALTEAKALLRFISVVPFAAAADADGGLRRLGEQLAAVFCVGVTNAVDRSLSTEAAEWVWRHVVLVQPALATALPWDVSSPSVANTARAQGWHWLTLLAECHWSQLDDGMVRCGWWMCALLADVVALNAEQRRVLAEAVVLALPTTPMLRAGAAAGGPPTHPHPSFSSEKGGRVEGNAEESSAHDAGKSPEYARQEAREKDEGARLYAVVQHLFLSVLRKAETYPRTSLDRLLLHISDALPPARVGRDTAFHRLTQPLLVRLCSRQPEVQQSLSANAAPWLQEWTAAARQSVTACLAEQERRFRQFEIEEETLERDEENAARLAEWAGRLRQSNERKRVKEMDEERRSSATASSLASRTNLPESDPTCLNRMAGTSGKAGGKGDVVMAAAPSSSSRQLRQQRLFPDRPLQLPPPTQQQQCIGVKRERSPASPAPPSTEGRSPTDQREHGTNAQRSMQQPAEALEVVIVDDDDADVVEFEVDSDMEEVVATDRAMLGRLLRASPPTPPPAPLKAPRTTEATASTGGRQATVPAAPPPTRLQQRLQAINARNTHRVHHAAQLRALQDRLCRVAASTNLLRLQPPLLNDIIGSDSQCMAPTVPVLPEVFVSATAVLGGVSASNTSVAMPFGDAASAYAARFAPHIALELRCDVVRNYEDFIEQAGKTPPHGENRNGAPHCNSYNYYYCNNRKRKKGGGRHNGYNAVAPPPPFDAATPAAGAGPLSWTQLLPLHPSIPLTCFAVHHSGASRSKSAPDNSGDSLRFCFSIRASANRAVHQQWAPRYSEEQNSASSPWPPPPPPPVDPAVRSVAEQGLSAGLAEGDVVVVLLPLHALGAAWVERRLGVILASLSEWEQAARVQEALSQLPDSWRMLGCLPQVCYVQSLLPGERTAQLCAYQPVEARDLPSSVPPLRFLHAWHAAYSNPQNAFYVKKLTSLNSFQMELAALHSIDHTRFAATLYDPCYAAPLNAVFYEWITGLLTATGPAQRPLLAQLCARLLLRRQLNDWQLRAIIAVLYATCDDWDGGDAQRCLGGSAPRAPEVLLIEGPPGTGKTQTIASLTLNLLHHLNRRSGPTARVLVCAPSNCAVDEALLRVVHLREQLVKSTNAYGGAVGSCAPSPSTSASSSSPAADGEPRPSYDVLSGGILRVGVKDRVDAAVLRLAQPVFLDDVVEQCMTRAVSGRGGRAEAASTKRMSERNAIRASTIESASIIFSTLGSLHHIPRQVQGLTFDVVIVDEASQGTEPAVLQALVLARSKCVLVGDSKQLQPTILSRDASRCGLRRSLLVRMLACGHKSFLLRTQYRMHPDICAFPNAYFYDSKLETHSSVHLRARGSDNEGTGLLSDDVASAAATAHDPANLAIAQRLGQSPRFVFADVPAAVVERRRGRSLFNRKEAAAVVQYMRQLRTFLRLTVWDMAPQLGIITFYNAQKVLILSLLTREERQSGLQVSTVDSFQGKEKRIILLSCVRTVQRWQLLAQRTHATSCTIAAAGEGERNGSGRPFSGFEGPTFEERVDNRRVGRFGLGFLADGHRLNVALTRAQDLCVCFGSRDSLEAVAEAVMAVCPSSRSGSAHDVTTADSAPDAVVEQLIADEEDPLALYCMLRHAEEHDRCLHQPAQTSVALESLTESVETVATPAEPAAASACVCFHVQTPLMEELTKRARVSAETPQSHPPRGKGGGQ
ncbi:hypothetical protein ABB37_07018 [Leptomonas pyrrhocoris]|uniref:Uncharacterized protein n=1 Tax=Leptomonas pyrrhocoris TaxID=157538 RepID=A0A0M9FX00_LEPPY|nr:hypothetical protein ABB37_07018 [Leptomonas pyrrhocoris]XP_015656117.1 hypothetical protein ABB37_07018 [Leptomonas pyrrhocoris]XP_015656118.1 hypothetical protein ABB37_07018 [Leptomonas pyrrhocoris]KPA77677.1 hypothetical protein ABB37_07018 [Leptomonas pyrrhocoris]KPA77678.1 hypothetical protein ABB37_07018 [Leptomonas pyrrhocoris]KPA77679.1 hypothetical protein ABB37_07018 [Leptomonas pyrrhocoris]|eukprot:XP_015656116.1 hypothetical protein ABB37_07018 [Leptomonas pyrrhocoris]